MSNIIQLKANYLALSLGNLKNFFPGTPWQFVHVGAAHNFLLRRVTGRMSFSDMLETFEHDVNLFRDWCR